MPVESSVTIRVAEVQDARAIARVRAESRRASYRSFLPAEQLEDPAVEDADARWYERGLAMAQEGRRIDVAERAGDIVGYCASSAAGVEGWSGGWIFDLFVAPSVWRRGVGRALLESAMAFLRDSGCTEAALFIFEANERARAFYEAAGWRADGHREVSEDDGGAVALRYRVSLGGAA